MRAIFVRPLDPWSITHWRQHIGDDGADELLKQTIQTAIKSGYLKEKVCV